MIYHLLKSRDGTRNCRLILLSSPDNPKLCILYLKNIQFPQRAERISTKTMRIQKTLLNCLSEVNLYFQLLWDGEIVGFGYPANFSNSQNHRVSEVGKDLKRSSSTPC